MPGRLKYMHMCFRHFRKFGHVQYIRSISVLNKHACVHAQYYMQHAWQFLFVGNVVMSDLGVSFHQVNKFLTELD